MASAPKASPQWKQTVERVKGVAVSMAKTRSASVRKRRQQRHLAQARLRAVEQGLPLARVAQTGISAMIDPAGRITGQIPLHTAGALDVALPAPLPPTPYARWMDSPLHALLALALLGLLIDRRRRAG